MPSNYLSFCYPLLLLPSIFPSIRVFSNESVLHIRWPKYWSFSSASVFPMNIQDWFALGWTGLICSQSKRLSRVFSNTTFQKHQFFCTQLSLKSKAKIWSSSSWLSGFSCLLCSSYYKAPSKFLNGSSRNISRAVLSNMVATSHMRLLSTWMWLVQTEMWKIHPQFPRLLKKM